MLSTDFRAATRITAEALPGQLPPGHVLVRHAHIEQILWNSALHFVTLFDTLSACTNDKNAASCYTQCECTWQPARKHTDSHRSQGMS